MKRISLIISLTFSILNLSHVCGQIDSIGTKSLEKGELYYAHASGHITFFNKVSDEYSIIQITGERGKIIYLFDKENLTKDTLEIKGFVNFLMKDNEGNMQLEIEGTLATITIDNGKFKVLSSVNNNNDKNYVYFSDIHKLSYLKKGKNREWVYEGRNLEKPLFEIGRKERKNHHHYGGWGRIIEPVYLWNNYFYFSNSYGNSILKFDLTSNELDQIDIKHDSLYIKGNVFLLKDYGKDKLYLVNYKEENSNFKLFFFDPQEQGISYLKEFKSNEFPPSSIFNEVLYSIGRFDNKVSVLKHHIFNESFETDLIKEN
ncbi:MAG: hypothetical protein DSY77_17430 [Bacteroidetes bacterium]|jgi:hypothetical protein|nr:MAG: hypothetical protein DSY77_17430 [Bacteroidota bacterium]